MTDEQLAALYPSATPPSAGPTAEPAAVSAPVALPNEAPTAVPQNIRELRAADPDRRLHDGSHDAGAVHRDLVDLHGVDAREWSRVASDLQAGQNDLHTFSMIAAKHMNESTTTETHASWVQESKQYLRDMRVTEQQKADVRKLIARDPRIQRLYDTTPIFDHPRVLARMVDLARTARIRGDLGKPDTSNSPPKD